MPKGPSAVFRLCNQCELVHGEHTTCPGCGSPLTVADESYFLGKLFGKFKMEGILGVGGMGVVYQAVHTTLNRKAAVKFVLPQMTDDQFLQRFLREIQILAELKHPNIVEIYDYDVSNWGPPYYVMEYLEGKTLRSVLNHHSKGLPLEVAAPLIQNMCSALGHAHRRGVVHRDLKPENIFIAKFDHQSVAKVLDFGIAKLTTKDHEATNITSTGIVMGTPHYLAPEQVLGKNMGPHTDQYALALILAEIFSGTAIRAGKTVGEIVTQEIHKGLSDDFLESKTISDQIKNALRKAVEVKPEDRFADMEEFLQSLGLTDSKKSHDLFAGPSEEDANAPTMPTPLGNSEGGVDVRELAHGSSPTMDTPRDQYLADATAQTPRDHMEQTTPTPVPHKQTSEEKKKLTGKLAAQMSSLETAMTPMPRPASEKEPEPAPAPSPAPKVEKEPEPAPAPPPAPTVEKEPEPAPVPPPAPKVEKKPEPAPAPPPAPKVEKKPEPAPAPPPAPKVEKKPAPAVPVAKIEAPKPKPEKKKKSQSPEPKKDKHKSKRTKLKQKAIHAAKEHLTPSGTPRPASVQANPDKGGKSKTGMIMAIAAVVVLSVAAYFLVPKFMGGNDQSVAENTEPTELITDVKPLEETPDPADPKAGDDPDPVKEDKTPPKEKVTEPEKQDKEDPEAVEAKRFLKSTRTAQADMSKAQTAISKASTKEVKEFAPDLLEEAKNTLQGASTGFKRAQSARDMDQVSAAARESITLAKDAKAEAHRQKLAWDKTEAARLTAEAEKQANTDAEPKEIVKNDPEPVKEDPKVETPTSTKPKHGELVKVHLLDMPIQPTKAIRVKYTSTAKQGRVKGRVTVKCLVDTDGSVIETKLSKGIEKDLGLNDRALEAVGRATFDKPTSQGIPVKVWAHVTLVLKPPARGFSPGK